MNPFWIRILFFLIILLFSIISCQETKEDERGAVIMFPSEGVEYISDANGTAYIYLLIKGDNTFHFRMIILPQPMEENKKEEVIESNGTWEPGEKGIKLVFDNNKIDAYAIFDKKQAKKEEVNVLDKHTVELNIEKEEITIWGVVCAKRESRYLKDEELYIYFKKAKPVMMKDSLCRRFSDISFDKVIAYDFDGAEEEHPSVLRNGKLENVIIHQSSLNEQQVDNLITILTDTSTYGATTAACFEPHLGIVFFKGEKKVIVIDVCLGCNYLSSTVEIPATEAKKIKIGDDYEYGANGFSKDGRLKIIKLCRELKLDYGKMSDKEANWGNN